MILTSEAKRKYTDGSYFGLFGALALLGSRMIVSLEPFPFGLGQRPPEALFALGIAESPYESFCKGAKTPLGRLPGGTGFAKGIN